MSLNGLYDCMISVFYMKWYHSWYNYHSYYILWIILRASQMLYTLDSVLRVWMFLTGHYLFLFILWSPRYFVLCFVVFFCFFFPGVSHMLGSYSNILAISLSLSFFIWKMGIKIVQYLLHKVVEETKWDHLYKRCGTMWYIANTRCVLAVSLWLVINIIYLTGLSILK